MDFSKFDKAIDKEKLRKDVEEAEKNGGGSDVEKGTYIVQIEKLEIGATKDGRPMLKAMARIQEGAHKKQCLFLNRVIYGTKNDSNMIAAATGFLKKLDSQIDPIYFEDYSQFNELVMDIAEDIIDIMEYEVDYDPDAFNSITIKDAYELD